MMFDMMNSNFYSSILKIKLQSNPIKEHIKLERIERVFTPVEAISVTLCRKRLS
ncbi:hypothetical protein HanXRQr2_Chr11g0501941 [Helianthus annuus]|uniref:Uncharacterized protein n=1 Tax=Helianthus annuus TaxID=4232 RepID=A0A251TC59_HELAN|nr:hypothetical protein HanXRQr2_Chr11g0501941 [Helianthus annuus]